MTTFKSIRTLSLFSGIGGIDLGLERTGGFKVVGQCEIDPFCREVLKKHWPEVWLHDDVTTLTGQLVRDNCGEIDCICGGFPCQPHSVAGKKKGREDERNLWPHYIRLVRELRPRWVLAENVPGIRTTMADEVIGDLEAAGYACWPLVVGADDAGAPHRRKRVWFVAYAEQRKGFERHNTNMQRGWSKNPQQTRLGYTGLGHTDCLGRADERNDDGRLIDGAGEAMANASFVELGNPTGNDQWWNGKGSWRQKEQVGGSSSGYCWPARPGHEQHDWEEPRLTQFEVGCFFDGLSERLVRPGLGRGEYEGMHDVRGTDHPQEVREVHGDSQTTGSEDALQCGVLRQIDGKRQPDTGGCPHAESTFCPECKGLRMRLLQVFDGLGGSSHGQQPTEQQSKQFGDDVPKMSRVASHATKEKVRAARAHNRNALKAYGNAVVPQIVEAIGRAIIRVELVGEKTA